MTGTPFEKAMEGFRAELVNLVRQRNATEARINQITHAMEAMARTCEDSQKTMAYLDDIRGIAARIGFQDAIRSALGFPGHLQGMTPVEIRDFISKSGWMDLGQYNNPLASIHTTLRRMKDNEEVEEIDKGGDKAFRLKMAPKTRPIAPIARPSADRPRGLLDILAGADRSAKPENPMPPRTRTFRGITQPPKDGGKK
jgi:hypothetical protein